MNESEHLAAELDRALNGGAWHGPSWREALEGVSRTAALRRPIPEAHSIAEIVLHATTWHDVVRRRLEGENPQVSDQEDWPAARLEGDQAWSETLARLFESGRALESTVRAFPPERLSELRPRLDDTWRSLVDGELHHAIYHAGQVALLRKSAGGL